MSAARHPGPRAAARAYAAPVPYDLIGVPLVLVVVAALVVGFSKTAIGGFGVISAAIFASVMPARESTGAVLLLLIIGDVLAVLSYRRDANWTLLRHLLPAMIPGLIVGTVVLTMIDNESLRLYIGILIALLVIMQLIVSYRSRGQELVLKTHHPAVTWLTGGAAGVATMTANSAGPITTLYLLSSGVDKKMFLGTAAWYFMIGNLIKVPFSAGIGLMPPATLLLTAILAPAVIVGGLIGRKVVKRIDQTWFNRIALGGTAAAAIALLVQSAL